MTTGFTKTANMLEIEKDIEAQLTYTFDWINWLVEGDSFQTVEYSVQARLNDPNPVTIVQYGTQGTKTYVEVAGGQLNKSYVITCKVTTVNGIIDRRNFRVYITNRSA
jgi:hypothetical protein